MIRAVALLLAAVLSLSAGDLSERYRLTLERVLTGGPPRYEQGFILADVEPRHIRRFTRFSGDVSGRYIGAVATAAADWGRDHGALDRLVSKVLLFQKPDGHFGAPPSGSFPDDDDMAMLWGNGRLLIGLLEDYRLTKRREVLEAAASLGDYLVKIAPTLNSKAVMDQFREGKFAVGYICWTQNTEGLTELYRLTGRREFRALAEEMAARTERLPSQHSHGFLSTLRGILELYRATGDPRFLEQVEREVQGVVESGNLLVHGAVPEAFRPAIRRDEGCTEADWLRLNLALWRETGKREYLERAETTLFNEFALNQFASGDFGHRVFAPAPAERSLASFVFAFTLLFAPAPAGRPPVADYQPVGVAPLGARAWWCCTLHGLRCFSDVRRAAFRVEGERVYYDLPVDSRLKLSGFAISADSTLQRDATVRLRVERSSGKRRALWIRRPGWARGIEVLRNGARTAAETSPGYVRVSRSWKKGDVLELRYALRTFESPAPGGERVVLHHGPWILGVDEATTPHYFDEPYTQDLLELPPAGPAGDLELDRAPSEAAGAVRPFSVPVAHFRVRYLPGGYPVQPATALLRPIAEQTGMAMTGWAFVFRRAGGANQVADQNAY